MRRYPNTCNNDVKGYCDKDLVVTICGDQPKRPGSKGMGGSPGFGGSGGYKVVLNVTSSTPAIMNFMPGTNGNVGNDGFAGRYGKWGAVRLTIGDRYCSSCAERVCVAKSAIFETVCHINLMNRETNNGSLTAISAGEPPSQLKKHTQESQQYSRITSSKTMAYSLSEFKPYVKVLLDNAAKNQNIFYKQELGIFLDFVKSNSLLV